MRALPLLLVVAAVWLGAVAALRARARGLAATRSADPDTYRNHLEMARLIERLMENDFVRGVVPEHEQHVARRVLREFYGDADPKEIR